VSEVCSAVLERIGGVEVVGHDARVIIAQRAPLHMPPRDRRSAT